MSFNELLHELPSLSIEERQLLVRRALELDDAGLSEAEEALVATRLAEHSKDPGSAIGLEEMNARLRARASK